MATLWNLKLLGGISVTGSPGPLSGAAVQDRRLALLAVLAMQPGGAARRDRVVALLWPESSVQRARHSLSDALYVLNKSFGSRAILASGDELRLDKAVVDCDVDLFELALSGGAWEEAADLYRGPFLDGFHVSGSVEFEEWAGIERERLERAHAQALERLAEENPLAVAAGVAVLGLACGLLIPESEREQRLMGPVRDDLVHRAQETASHVSGC